MNAVIAFLSVFFLVVNRWSGKKPWDIVRWLWRWGRKRWEAARQRRRRQQLPQVGLPPVINIPEASARLTLDPVQHPAQNAAGLSVTRLLGAVSSPVPFLDRAGILADLEAWAVSDEPFALCVLGGDGGSGKTRLGVELCRRLSAAGARRWRRSRSQWRTGFLRGIEGLEPGGAHSGSDTRSLLLVVDYAETRSDIVGRVINLALTAARDASRRRIRVLFLVRRPAPLPASRKGADPWVDSLRPQGSQAEGINRLLDEAMSMVLNEQELSEEDRQRLFDSAVAVFHEAGAVPSRSENLSRTSYSQPLPVIATAFLSATRSTGLPPASEEDVFDGLLAHEERYWELHWPDARDFDRALARQVAALATLAEIEDEDDAVALLGLLPAAENLDHNELTSLAGWLRECYPPPLQSRGAEEAWCGHLEPDRLGERLITSEIGNLETALPSLLAPARVGTGALRTWTVLERAADDPRVRELVGSALNDVLEELTQTVENAVIVTRSAELATALAALLRRCSEHISIEKARASAPAMKRIKYLITSLRPAPTQRISEATTSEETASKTLKYSMSTTNMIVVLICLVTASILTLNIGSDNRFISAVTFVIIGLATISIVGGFAVTHDILTMFRKDQGHACRAPAQDNPSAYNPDLATALSTLANRLDEDGQRPQALDTVQEVVDLRRELAHAEPRAFGQAFLDSLSLYADLLEAAGLEEEAAAVRREREEFRARLEELEED
ncbi:proton-translocating transhydrogenase family protein [Actinomyces bowdenii]|uniref:proton-translocating transhydrogenase family protein n=1 Tax=Actinomyces bowdenii TaxID=131109 RepID=UPI00163A6E8C|nr:proton-translocating transhydrogenase family protein [Actinomyces bowdenii]